MRLALRKTLAIAAFSILLWPNTALAAPPTPLFASDDTLHLTLRGPVDHMSRAADAKPVAGLLTVDGAAPESLPIQLLVRGITRARKETCPFPPLSVEFTAKPAATSIFKGQKTLKLVTHCRPAENFQQYVLLEYATYLLYNALTPESFNVRLAMINYVGENGQPIISRLGYFMEDVDDVAQRNGQTRLRSVNRISFGQLDPAAAQRVALFEYMISNLDWSMTAAPPGDDCCHNSRLLGMKGSTTGLIPVPYDFDFSGLVNAPYAVPPNSIRVANVRIRIYRGFCQHNEQAQAAAADLMAHRAAMLAILDRIPGLDQGPRQRAAEYLDEFFDRIGTPAQVAEIVKACLG